MALLVGLGASVAFAATTYQFTTTKSGSGTITPSFTPAWDSTTDPSVTATADVGYHIATLAFIPNRVLQTSTSSGDEFTGTSGTGSNETTWAKVTWPNSDTSSESVAATFAINVYQINTGVDPVGGGSITGSMNATWGTSPVVQIQPSIGYFLYRLVDNTKDVLPLTSSYVIPNVSADHNISAYFSTGPSITTSAGAHGTVVVQPTQPMALGADATVTITPATGYHIATLTDNGVAVPLTSPYVISDVQANHNIAATFAINTYTITPTAGTGGSISPTSSQVATSGTTTTFTVTPNTGYTIATITVNSVPASNPVVLTNVSKDTTVGATFLPIPYTLTYSAGSHGSITPTGTLSQIVKFGSSGTTVTAVADSGYHFVTWSDGGTNASRADVANADATMNAIFAVNTPVTPVTYALKYIAGSNGTITGTLSQTVNSGASGTAVTAVANSGYHFLNWSDGVTTASRTDTNVTANMTVTALFAANTPVTPVTTYTLKYIAGSGGTITGTASQTVNSGASGAAVTAVANSGYHFLNWSDGVSTASRTDANVTANMTVTALFAANTASTFTITGTAGANGTMSVIGAHTVAAGSSLTVIMTPSTYYTVSSVLVDGVSVGAVPAYTFTNVSASHTISVTFVRSTRIWTALTFKSTPTTSYHGHKFVFTGKISPSSMRTGTRITIWMRKSGHSWRKLGTVYTNGYDNYSYTLYNAGRTHGKYYVRAKYAGNSVYANCYSPYKTVYIK